MRTALIWIWAGVLVILVYGFLVAERVFSVGGTGQGADIGGGGVLLLGVVGLLTGAVLLIVDLFRRWKRPKS